MNKQKLNKSIWINIVLSLLLLIGTTGIIANSTSPAFAQTKYSDQKEKVVYITRTGKKYHRFGCRYLRYSRIKITKREAIEEGYTPCKICRP